MFSNGFTVKIPGDTKGKKPFIDRSNRIERIPYEVTGNVTAVPLGVLEVLPQLKANPINIINTPSVVAEQLLWASKLDTINRDVSALVTRGVVLSTKRLNALPSDLRTILLETGKVAASSLGKLIQDADDVAFTRLQSTMRFGTLTANELSQWNTTYSEVRRRLAQGTFAPDLVSRLEQLAN